MDSELNSPATNQPAADIAAPHADGLQRAYVTPEEFVKLSGLSLSSVWRYLADGRLPKFQPGGHRCRVLIPRDALERAWQSKLEAEDTTTTNEPERPEATPADDMAPRDLAGPQPRWRR